MVDGMSIKVKHILIGDVHGDYRALEKMLYKVGIVKVGKDKWVTQKGFKAVLLGDLNDPKSTQALYSSWKALSIGRELSRCGVGIVLQSNHQERLVAYLEGRGDVALKGGLDKTVKELRAAPCLEVERLKVWLKHIPLTYSFEVGKTLFSCVHAYFPHPQIRSRDPRFYRSLCVNGVMDEEGKRVSWWEYPELVPKDRVVVCGHYHRFFRSDRVVILDGNCGTNRGILWAFIPEENRFMKVLGCGWNMKTPNPKLEGGCTVFKVSAV